MKINTISAYLLVYLLARGHWNLMVPVRAEEESDVSTGSASADGGSTAGGSAEGTALTASAGGSGSSTRKAGSKASSTAGSTAGSEVANLSDVTSVDPDGSDGSAAPENSSSGEGTLKPKGDVFINPADNFSEHPLYTGASLSGGSAVPAAMVELGNLYSDYGSSVVEYTEGAYGKAMLDAKREEAQRVAEDARKTAAKLLEAAEKIKKEAEELSKAAEVAKDADELAAKMDAAAYNVGVAKTGAAEDSKPLDWTYYGGFPNGHHYRATDEMLIKLYKQYRRENNELYYDSFPDGWHAARFGDLDLMENDAKKHRDEKYRKDSEAKRQQITAKAESIAAVELKIADKEKDMKDKQDALLVKHNELAAKRQEVSKLREQIADLYKKLSSLETEARALAGEHGGLLSKLGTMELEYKKLVDDKNKLKNEHELLIAEDVKLFADHFNLNVDLKYLHEPADGYGEPSNYESFASAAFTVPGLVFDFGEGEAKTEGAEAKAAGSTVELGSLYPDMGGSTVEVAAKVEVADAGLAVLGAEVDSGKVAGESADASLTVVAEENTEAAEAKSAEAKESGEAAPAPEALVASTPVATPANEEVAPEAKPAEGAASIAEGAQTVPAAVRLFKADANGAEVEMTEADFTKKHVSGDDRYEFVSGVKCVKVMYGTREVWKKGEHTVDEPKFVAYNENAKALAVRDNERAVVYKKETDSDNWKHHKTVERSKTSGTSKTAAQTGTTPAPAAETTPEPGSLASSSALSGSKLNLAEASTGSGEAEDTSSVTSEGSEGDSGTGLRGATA